MLGDTRRLSIITLSRRPTPPPSPAATPKKWHPAFGSQLQAESPLAMPRCSGQLLLDQRGVIRELAKSVNNHRSLPNGPSWSVEEVQAKGR